MFTPYWLLKLLPVWSFICPSCKTLVAKESFVCIRCGERYKTPLRVPPKCLKNPKLLEEYVHKHIFPKISNEQRKYLTQYFTVIFQDGFESGDTSLWTGEDKNATVTVDGVNPYSGSFAMKIVKSAANHYAAVYKDLGVAQDELYGRVYVYWDNNPTNNTEIRFTGYKASGSSFVTAGLRNSGGTIQWYVKYLKNSATVYDTYNETPSTSTWYYLELYAKIDGAAGAIALSRNGTEIISDSGFDNNDHGNIDLYKVGADYETSAYTVTSYTDCAVLSDAAIGSLEKTKTVTMGGLIKAEGQTKTVTMGGLIKDEGRTETFTMGGLIINRFTKTTTMGGRIKAEGLITTFTMSSHIRKSETEDLLDIIHTNIKPSKGSARFQCSSGGDVYLQEYYPDDIGNMKVWLAEIPFTVTKLHKAAEYATLSGGADVEDLADDTGASARLNAQNEQVTYYLNPIDTYLPEGRYILLIRMKDTNQVADDCLTVVYNITDGRFMHQENDWTTRTLTGSWAYYQLIFDVVAADAGDNVQFLTKKNTATANIIYVDYFLIIPISNGESWPQDLAHNLLRNVGQKFNPVRRK